MKIEWNKVTWYSKLCAIIFFLLILPMIVFDIGYRYAQTKYALSNEDSISENINLFLENEYKNSSATSSEKSGPPSIVSISPVSGPSGTKVTVTGSGFNATQNSVVFGNTVVLSAIPSKNGTITFTVPDNAGPEGCTNASGSCTATPTLPGIYVIQIANINGVTSSKNTTFTVTSSR